MRTASLLAATAAAALAAPAFAQFQLTADYDFYWYFGNPGSGNVGDQYLIINDASTTPGGVDDGQGGILPYELFRAVAVIGDTDQPISPCGVCRQVLAELCEPDMPVVLANLRGETRMTTVSELLPGAFSPRDLNNREAPEGD